MSGLPRNRYGSGQATFSSGVIMGSLGHLFLVAWILAAFVTADTGEEAGTSVMPALAELFLTREYSYSPLSGPSTRTLAPEPQASRWAPSPGCSSSQS